ncbi:MAG TPA: DUF1499 domain-containing protein [Burkholderiales bacterium]|nr:DUF1499 domain-containing protein [Burkholderiales bacterium]
MFAGTRPDNLGVKDARFVACKPTPNCVSSQADPADREHYIEPIAYTGTMHELRRAVESMTRASVIREDGNYLYAEYKSALLGYVDDVELLLDEKAALVHVRSASRLGRSDFGVNRKRIEELRGLIGGRN